MTCNTALTNIHRPENVLQENICMMSVQLKLQSENDKWKERQCDGAHCSVRVLEESPGLLVGAHFLHANLLQGGAVGAPLLTADQRACLLPVQEHWGKSSRDRWLIHNRLNHSFLLKLVRLERFNYLPIRRLLIVQPNVVFESGHLKLFDTVSINECRHIYLLPYNGWWGDHHEDNFPVRSSGEVASFCLEIVQKKTKPEPINRSKLTTKYLRQSS